MAGLCSVVCTILLLSLYSVDVQAESQIFPSGDITYWSPGSLVQLPWTYNYTKSEISTVQWLFTKSGSNTARRVAVFGVEFGATKPTIEDPMFNITGQATLEFKNANLSHNGTYTFKMLLRNGATKESKILVIILVRPVANISCTTPVNITEGGNFSCICSGVNGNPPATAYWYKDNNSTLKTEGYLSALLDIKNASKKDNGTYICRAQSGTLTDEQRVDITVFVRPEANISCTTPVNVREGENVSCICSGVGGNPPATAHWLKDNNAIPITEGYLSVPLDIRNISKSDNGTYTCRVQSGPLTDERRVDIIVFVQPAANISCTTPVNVTEGENFSCICSGVGGNPPPTAYWLKDNNPIPMTKGYLSSPLDIRNASKNDNGTYTCRVQSGPLTDERRVEVTVFVRPVANISCTTPVNVREGENVSCVCSGVGGNPPATAYWLKGNNPIPITKGYVSSLLDIRNVSKNDNGTYTCRVQSGPLTDEGRVDIIVFVQPVANISCATPMNVTEGGNFSCICSGVGGNPPPNAHWLKDNTTIPMTKGYLSSPLNIKNVSKSDNGTYTCRVQSGPLTDEQRVEVTVFVRPVANINCTTPVNITEGENVSCICSGVGGNPSPTAYWLKDNNSTPITKGYVSALLDIKNVSKNDNGTYTCRAQSGPLTDEKRVDITVFVRPVANISCTIPVDITEGENVSCICSGVGGNPPATAYWLKENNSISITKGYVNALLDIKTVSKNDNGTYICRAQSGPLTDEQRVEITVFDKPVANVTCNTSVSIKEGNDFSCNCSGNDGSPPPSVMWLKDNNELTTVDNILTLRNISKLNNGTYVCRVQSGNLWEEKRVDVTVLYEPRNISFSSNEPNNNVTSGDTVKITCKADASPEASYTISVNGSQPLTGVVNGAYTINSVNDSHAGNYTCVAKNSLGSVSAHFVLTVRDVDECLQASICPTGSFCVNTVGSYKCNCNEGLYKNETGQCVKGVSYRATFKLNITFTADLENSSSPAYITLASNLISAISSAYQNNNFFFAVLVNGFSKGSVVANVTIIFNTSRSSPLAELKKVKNGKLGNYTVDLSSIKLIEVARPTSTLIMPSRTVNPSASTSTAVPGAPPGDKKKSNTGLIAGAVAGGIVFLIILILIIWYCKRSAGGSRKRNMSGREDDIVGNHSNPSYVAAMGDSMDRGNQYESVDQAKIDEARDDEAGPSNESPPDAGNENPPDAGKESPADAGNESPADAGKESPADAGKKSPPDAANSLPPVYAVVDKSKITPKPPPEKQPDALTYASLDPVLLQPDSSKMRDRTREETNYASIDLDKLNEHQV